MEITDRATLGEDLRAPISGREGREVWHYSLVSHTQPGDVVFHWHTTLHDRPALVGWSTVLGPLREESHEWTPHAGSLLTAEGARPNWVMPLGGVHYLDAPISLAEIEAMRADVLRVREELEAERGTPSYFPFTKYGAVNLRAAQAYLTKLPRQLVDLLAGRYSLELGDEALSLGDTPPTAPDPRSGGQGFLRDTARKLAIERHAVARAIEHYQALGAQDIEVLGKPYDLRVLVDGQEVHVEVKGSGGELTEILVTRNEVAHARSYARVELVVVDAIEWRRDASEQIVTSGGRLRHWASWRPTDASLTPVAFSHELPVL